ncbi:albumin [Trifolium pratense]|uniref:Albumin n=1 Tax=Trifolium pratense TaxID=57577 RepID=A0A2K3P5J1_TRIPR|nr:albumin [Trifolium pratense]
MAYVKFVFLSAFLLAIFATFPIKKVEAAQCMGSDCTLSAPCAQGCYCGGFPASICRPTSYNDAVKIVGENLICQDNAECKNKGTKNFCVRYPKPDVEYGVCADSIFEAENLILKIFSKSKLPKEEIPTIIT